MSNHVIKGLFNLLNNLLQTNVALGFGHLSSHFPKKYHDFDN